MDGAMCNQMDRLTSRQGEILTNFLYGSCCGWPRNRDGGNEMNHNLLTEEGRRVMNFRGMNREGPA